MIDILTRQYRFSNEFMSMSLDAALPFLFQGETIRRWGLLPEVTYCAILGVIEFFYHFLMTYLSCLENISSYYTVVPIQNVV